MSERDRFLDAMGDIDQELLREHIEYKKKMSLGRMIPAAVSAAAVILAVGVAIPFLTPRHDTIPQPDTTDDGTTAVEPVERLVLYSELSGVPAYDENYTPPADGEVRIGSELESALNADTDSDVAFALVLKSGSSEYLNSLSDPELMKTADEMLSINEERMAAFKEKFISEALEHLRTMTEGDYKYKTSGYDGSISDGIEKIKEKYSDIVDLHRKGEIDYQEFDDAMTRYINDIDTYINEYKAARTEFQMEYFEQHGKLDLLYEEYAMSIRDELVSVYGDNNSSIYWAFDISFRGVDIYGTWRSSRECQQYWDALEKRENGIATEVDMESLVRSWLEEYSQNFTKKMRAVIDRYVFNNNVTHTVTKTLTDSGINYSFLEVKTVSEENIVTNDTDCVIAIMTKEQIESFDVPETVGVELDLAPYDWQDEDSDGVVYSLQRK